MARKAAATPRKRAPAKKAENIPAWVQTLDVSNITARTSASEPAHLAGTQPAANSSRGEFELTLQGVTYRLRPSREALKAIEDRTKMSVLKLAQLGNVADLTIKQLGIIAEQLIRAGAEDEATRYVGADRLEELIQDESIARVTGRLTYCLAEACTGGATSSGNVKAATA